MIKHSKKIHKEASLNKKKSNVDACLFCGGGVARHIRGAHGGPVGGARPPPADAPACRPNVRLYRVPVLLLAVDFTEQNGQIKSYFNQKVNSVIMFFS